MTTTPNNAGSATGIDLAKMNWNDMSTADPVEKARRVLNGLTEHSIVHFFNDGFPRREIEGDAKCVLAVLDALARATPQHPDAKPLAWMDPSAGCVMDAFLWQKDAANPQYSQPVYAAPAVATSSTGAQAAAAEVRDEWIGVDERLPEEETDVLVRGRRGDSICHEVAGLFHGEWLGQNSELELRFIVEHWQPLPAAPVISSAGDTGSGG